LRLDFLGEEWVIVPREAEARGEKGGAATVVVEATFVQF
jgi:hypothetical protein